jgi:hypothetical protein
MKRSEVDPQITQINADFLGLATDPHRLTRTFVRRTSPDKNSHRFAKKSQKR